MSSKYLDALHRLAMIQAHQWKCVICRKAIIEEFVIDHMIPKELGYPGRENELAALLKKLERPTFDIYGLGNLGPAHYECNNRKGEIVYPPEVLHERLTFIGNLVAKVERIVVNGKRSRGFEKAMLLMAAAIDAGETSAEAVAAKLARSAPAPTMASPNYAMAWTPKALEQLRNTGESLEFIERALVSAAQRGQMRFQANPSLPNAWVFRFTTRRKQWRAFATLDNGLLLITGVAEKTSRS